MAHRQVQPQYTNSFLDSCAINPGGPEEECSKRIIAQKYENKLNLQIGYSVLKEINHQNSPQSVKSDAEPIIFTYETSSHPNKERHREDIFSLVKGNASGKKHEKDAEHIYDLYKNGGGYFITTDTRLLKLSNTLMQKYLIQTITPCKFEKLL